MQVYKTFFRIFRQHRGFVILYLCIFMGAALIISSNNANEGGKEKWKAVRCPFAVFDEDHSELSEGMIAYIGQGNEKIGIEDSEKSVTDELYEDNVVCVLRIPGGFGDSVEAGKEVLPVEITAAPGSIYSRIFQELVQDYVRLVRYYLAGGADLTEAQGQAEKLAKTEVPVTVKQRSGDELHGSVYYFFIYLPYILISICVAGLGPGIMAFQRKEVKYRSRCSAYSDTRMNIEILLASFTAGLLLCTIYFLLVLLGTGGEALSFRGFLHVLNMLSFLPVALGIAFLAGQVFRTGSTLMMAANVIGLGMSFLGGVFAPVEFLGERLARAVHLLPVYWYTCANRFIDSYVPGTPLQELWQCMGVQLMFGIALFCVSLAWLRSRLQENSRNMYKEKHF